jgi:hypothetical protein
MKKRIVTLLLALCLLVGLLPTVALAGDGTYKGTEGTNTGAVATITTSGKKVYYYTDFATAVSDVQNGDTITLLKSVDVTLNSDPLTFSKTEGETEKKVTLDLAGYTISLSGTTNASLSDTETKAVSSIITSINSYKNFIAISKGVNLTIQDKSVSGNGAITLSNDGVAIYNAGTLTIESGKVDTGKHNAICVVNSTDSTLTVKTATLKGKTAIYNEAKMAYDEDSNTITFSNEGTLYIGDVSNNSQPSIKIDVESSGTTSIVNVGNAYLYSGEVDSGIANLGSLTISGSTINEGTTAIWGYFGSANISGGTVKGKIEGSADTIKITGGTFSTNPKDYYTSEYVAKENDDDTYTVGPKAKGVSITGATTVAYGDTLKLTATKDPADAISTVTWSSDNEDIAKVSKDGVVTPHAVGTAKIIAEIDGVKESVTIKVEKATTALNLTASTTSLEGGGTVTLTATTTPANLNTTVKCSDSSITVTDNKNGTFTATLPNATVNYTFTVDVVDDNYQGSQTTTVNVTRYVAATGTTTTTNKTETTTETLPAETDETANAQVGEEEPAVEVVSTETVTDPETGTVTTTTEKSDGSTTVVEEKTDGTVTTTDTTAEGAVKVVEKTTDGTVTTTDTAVNGVETYTKEVPGQQVTAKVTIPETVESAVVTIPVSGELTAGMVAMDADTGEIIMLSALTEDGLSLKLDSSRNIVIVDNSKDFDDVPENNWVTDGIDYATAHNLFGGTSETTFDPDGDMTRAMLMTVLARFEGVNTDAGATWYEAGMNWAVENSISDGSDPNGSITREQLATMLYRYAGSPAVNGEVSGFTDSDEISSYASDAIAWAAQVGILTGNTRGELNPTATATRGQVATMMMRFGQNQVQ